MGTSGQRRQLGHVGNSTLTLGPGVLVHGGFADIGATRLVGGTFSLTNYGTISADLSGQSVTVVSEANPFINYGTVRATSGTLALNCPYTQFAGITLLDGGNLAATSPLNIQGGTLAGTNTLTGSVTNNGLVSPGASPGLLTIVGNYTQTANGAMNIDLAGTTPGTSFDRLAISGTATLAGTLITTLTNGFYPDTNAMFTFLTCGTRSGTFAMFNYPSNDVGMQVNYAANSGTIQVINVRPVLTVIPNQTNDELVVFSQTATATDDDRPVQTLTFTLTNSPPPAVIHPSSGLLTWLPTEADGPGTNSITVLVTDNGTPHLTVSRTFELVVNEINVAPVLILPSSQAINEQTHFGASATATDADLPTNAMKFELVSGPPGLTVSEAGAIAWAPLEADGPNSYTVKVRVTDTNQFAVNEKQLSTTNMFTITVNEVNLPPSLTVPGHQTLDEQTPLSVSASATDPDLPANALTFSLVSPPSGMMIDPGSGAISWTPDEAQGSNTYTIKVVVTDDSPLAINATQISITNEFMVTVNESNRPPVVGALADYTVNAGQTVGFTATATDPDLPAHVLLFSLVSPPSGATMNGSGLFNWRARPPRWPTPRTPFKCGSWTMAYRTRAPPTRSR